jgi:hypothetical protein
MVLRIIQSGNSLPCSFQVNPSCEFQSGQIAELSVMGNNVVCGVSTGLAPIGIIDDVKTVAFTNNAINETIIVGPIPGIPNSTGTLITPFDIKAELNYPHILTGSFVSDIDVELIPVNGVVRFIAGTPLNYDQDGDGIPDSLRTVVSYTYRVNNVPGDDSTAASGRVTVWIQRMIFQTDQFDSTCRYPINANLFCGTDGKLTSKQPSSEHPAIAIVSGSPTSSSSFLEAIWL